MLISICSLTCPLTAKSVVIETIIDLLGLDEIVGDCVWLTLEVFTGTVVAFASLSFLLTVGKALSLDASEYEVGNVVGPYISLMFTVGRSVCIIPNFVCDTGL